MIRAQPRLPGQNRVYYSVAADEVLTIGGCVFSVGLALGMALLNPVWFLLAAVQSAVAVALGRIVWREHHHG